MRLILKLNRVGVNCVSLTLISNVILFLLTFEMLSFGCSRRLFVAGLKIGRQVDFLRLTLFESLTLVFAFFILNYVLIRDTGFVKNHGKSSLAVAHRHARCSSKTLAVRVTLLL